jgi:hypothetical protein
MAEELEENGDAEVFAEAPPAPAVSHLPFIITLVALLLYFSFQTLSLLNERANLGAVKSNQDGALQEAQKVQAQFKTLVTKTGELAEQGHAGAKMIMEGLQKQGIGLAPETKAPEKSEAKPAK